MQTYAHKIWFLNHSFIIYIHIYLYLKCNFTTLSCMSECQHYMLTGETRHNRCKRINTYTSYIPKSNCFFPWGVRGRRFKGGVCCYSFTRDAMLARYSLRPSDCHCHKLAFYENRCTDFFCTDRGFFWHSYSVLIRIYVRSNSRILSSGILFLTLEFRCNIDLLSFQPNNGRR